MFDLSHSSTIATLLQAGPQISLYLTMFSTVASLLATIKNFGLVRLSRRMLAYLEAPPGVTVKKITKEQVNMVLQPEN